MSQEKQCPRCQNTFQCLASDVAHCGCSTVQLDQDQQRAIAKKWSECLCVACLKEFKGKSTGEING